MKVYAFLANGMEEVECLAVVDMLRRGGIEVDMVSVADTQVTGSHGITILADSLVADHDYADADLLFLPGGMPGVTNLYDCEILRNLLVEKAADGKTRIAAICAAPSMLGKLGILQGKTATCFPGFEEELAGAVYTRQGVVTDGLVTTARGVGFGIDLGLELVSLLMGEEVSAKLKAQIQHPDC